MDLSHLCWCSIRAKCPHCFFELSTKSRLRLHLKINTRRYKWFKNYALSSPVGFWVSIAHVIKWVITIWSISNKEVLTSWQRPKSATSFNNSQVTLGGRHEHEPLKNSRKLLFHARVMMALTIKETSKHSKWKIRRYWALRSSTMG